MSINLIFEPKVTLISHPTFINPEHFPANFIGESSDGEKLAEYAGRLCYLSQANKKGGTSKAYHEHIMSLLHGSVQEHVNYSFLVEGVSRNLTHELIRHGDGTAFSELSQRFVEIDGQWANFVVPPAIQEAPEDIRMNLLESFRRSCERSHEDHKYHVDLHQMQYADIPDATLRRKKSREAARYLLHSACETKMVFSANVRALRWIMSLRGSIHADAEIRNFSIALLNAVKPYLPNILDDMVVQNEGGVDVITYKYHKV